MCLHLNDRSGQKITFYSDTLLLQHSSKLGTKTSAGEAAAKKAESSRYKRLQMKGPRPFD